MDLQRGTRSARHLIAPHLVNQPLGVELVAGREREDGQKPSLGGPQRELDIVAFDPQGAEGLEPHTPLRVTPQPPPRWAGRHRH
jgi:hypothetical protein